MVTPRMITITANGEVFTREEGITLPDFLVSLGFAPEQVVIERNGDALTPTEVHSTCLEEGDQLEMVRIVAGG